MSYKQCNSYNLEWLQNVVIAVVYFVKSNISKLQQQVAQLLQRDRAAGWVSYGQKWKTDIGRQYFTDIIGLSSTTMT